jgi:prevent-host-death family protein
MEILQIREAKASFSALVAAAEKGRPTLVSRHGKPCAMVVPVADGVRLYPLEMPNLANYLLSLPEPLETERDTTPLRGIDFV